MPLRLSLLLLLLVAGVLRGLGQPGAGAVQAAGPVLVGVEALPDRGYDLARVRTDAALHFGPADSLRPAQARRYWLRLRVRNPSRYAAAAQLTVLPAADNTLYYFQEDAGRWVARRAGLALPTDSQRVKGVLHLPLPGQATTTAYVRVVLPARANLPRAVTLQVRVQDDAAARQQYYLYSIAGAASLVVLGLLLLGYLLAYLRFRDRILLYYAGAQLGGLLYLAAYRSLFKVVWPGPVFSLLVLPDGSGYAYTPNSIMVHLGVLLLLGGLGLMTRAYLGTARHLPRLDAALRYGLLGYAAFSAVVLLVNLSGRYLEYYSLPYDNALVAGLLAVLLTINVAAYQRRLPGAGSYLLANALPIVCILAVTLYNVAVSNHYDGALLLADLGIVMHALGFSVALGSRLRQLQQQLRAKEQAALLLQLDIREKQLRHQELLLDHKIIQGALREQQQQTQMQAQEARQLSADLQQHQATNQDLQQQLENNQRELASTALYVEQKNALLAELKQQLGQLGAGTPGQAPELAGIKSLLQSSLHLDEDWGRFKLHFEQVHPRFFEDLQTHYPALTRHELRLCGYFHLNLATKEIAGLLNIDPASVRRAKTRLYKKMAVADAAAGRSSAAEPGTEE